MNVRDPESLKTQAVRFCTGTYETVDTYNVCSWRVLLQAFGEHAPNKSADPGNQDPHITEPVSRWLQLVAISSKILGSVCIIYQPGKRVCIVRRSP